MSSAVATPVKQRPLSLRDWASLPDDATQELVDGRLEEAEVPDYVHEFIIMWLGRVVGNWGASRGALVAGSGGKFAVAERRGRMPDLTVYLAGAKRPPKRGLIEVPPSIAVEIVASTPRDARRDRIDKLDDYAAFGVRFYWIVDPELLSVEIFELGGDGRYVHALGAIDGVIQQVPGCAGLSIDVSALWREVDAIDAD